MLQSNIDIPYSATSIDNPNIPALAHFNLDEHRALVRRKRKSNGASKSNKTTAKWPSKLEVEPQKRGFQSMNWRTKKFCQQCARMKTLSIATRTW